MSSIDRAPNLIRDIRAMQSRISTLERGLNRVGQANNYPEWTAVAPSAPWGNVGIPGASGAEYYKDASGRVWVRGAVMAASPAAGPSTALVLPQGFRPPDLVVVPMWCDVIGGAEGVARCAVTTAGQVILSGYPAGALAVIAFLDAVTFRAV